MLRTVRFAPTLVAAAIVSAIACSALAQTYPSRAISFIYPYGPGSAADTIFRAVNQEVAKRLGQPVIHENRPGAGGVLGNDVIVRSAKDGYAIGMIPQGLAVFRPLALQKSRFEVNTDYTPIVLIFENNYVVIAPQSAPYRDLKTLISYAKANPGRLNAGTNGAGQVGHIFTALFAKQAGIEFTFVHYPAATQSIAATVRGDINLLFTDVGAKPHVDSGKVIALGITSSSGKRWNAFPDVPTLGEAGVSGLDMGGWVAVIGPAGLPADVVTKLNKAYNEALAAPEIRARLESIGTQPLGGTPADFGARVKREMELFRPVIQDLKLTMD